MRGRGTPRCSVHMSHLERGFGCLCIRLKGIVIFLTRPHQLIPSVFKRRRQLCECVRRREIELQFFWEGQCGESGKCRKCGNFCLIVCIEMHPVDSYPYSLTAVILPILQVVRLGKKFHSTADITHRCIFEYCNQIILKIQSCATG